MLEHIFEIFTFTVAEEHGALWLVLIIGAFFGAVIQYARIAKFEKIAGFAMLKDTVVPKMMTLAIGLSSIGIFFLVKMGYAEYHVKPMVMGGLIAGGILFGIAMAILGKCPGTGPVSIADGRVDVMIAAIGGLFGGLVYTVYFDFFQKIVGADSGHISLVGLSADYGMYAVLAFGILCVIISIMIPLVELEDEEENEMLKNKR